MEQHADQAIDTNGQPAAAPAPEASAATVEPPADGMTATPEAAADSMLLEQYLSQRDAPCPHCGYNLRGSHAKTCPECGRSVQLALLGSLRFAGHGLFILVALAWVFLAAGMNAARKGHQIHADAVTAATPIGQVLFTSSTSVTVNGMTTTWSNSGPGGTLVVSPPTGTSSASGGGGSGGGGNGSPPAPAGGLRARTFVGGSASGAPGAPIVITRSPQGGITFGPAPAAGAAAAGPKWSAIAVGEWWLLGWWSVLTLLALIGLVMLSVLRLRRKPAGRTATRVLIAMASVGFAGYAIYHLQGFVREAITWL